MKMIHMNVPGSAAATLEGYLLDCKMTLGQMEHRPAVLVLPGGGYLYCSDREGEPIALRYAGRGFHAFVLRYSTGRDAAGFAPLREVSWAIGYIREHADEWHIDPDKIAVCGFSAGGHLALSSGLLGENKPNAMILGYPATSAPNVPKADFMLKLLEGREDVTDEDAKKYDLVAHVTKDAPPLFLFATAEDMLTGICSLPLIARYNQLGMLCEAHIFQHGPHGYGLADETCANGSSRDLNPAFAHWHGLSVDWMYRIFGELTFVDKSNSKMAQYLREMGIEMQGF